MPGHYSIIIPVYNEEGNIYNIYNEIISINFSPFNYEIIFIDDGSTDNSKNILKDISRNKNIKFLSKKKNLGQSFAINTGIQNSKFENIITIDADGQNNPKDILKLLEVYEKDKYDLVAGIRNKRIDSYIKIISSRIANKVRSFILKDDCSDTGCSLKVFKKNIFLKFPFFDGIHRFLPALFKFYGRGNFYISVSHRPRTTGKSKYGTINRLIKGLIDIVRVKKIINIKK